MERKRILIVSPDSKHFVREYIENALLLPEYEVTFFTITQNPSDIEFYKTNDIHIKTIKRDNKSLCSNGLYVLKAWIWLFQNVNRFDAIHIHFVDVRFLTFCRRILYSNARVVMTYWGSDILRSSDRELTKMIPWIEKAYKINFNDSNSKEVFIRKFTNKYVEKLQIIDFGNSLLNIIDKEEKSLGKKGTKKLFGFPLDKYIIHVGYNGGDAQQHVKILDSLAKLEGEIKERIFIVIPFAYSIGGDYYSAQEYTRIVEEHADKTGIRYVICKDYLSGNRLADFRLTADVFIYGQTTDAMSATIVETVYAGGKIIKPVWLDYSELEEIGIDLCEYNDFCEIPEKLINVLNDFDDKDNNSAEDDKRAITSIKSWDFLAPKWRSMYE